jgi:uncharacterized membrane protein YraQ (UPF0718 family)
MSTSLSRPGGLTAIAILNVIGGFIGLIGGVFLFFADDTMNWAANQVQMTPQQLQQLPPQQRAEMEQTMKDMADAQAMLKGVTENSLYYPTAVVGLVCSAAMFVSGIGMWRMKKFSGQLIGNVYVGTSLLSAALNYLMIQQMDGLPAGQDGPGITGLIGPLYALLVAFLLNFTFSEDFE